jgi:hypothetical protein
MTTPPPLTLSSTVVASDNQVSSDLAGETVLLSLENARYFGFAGAGSRIWELIASPTRVADLCATLVREYDVQPDQCESDVLGFLRALEARGLLEVRGGV